MSEENQVVSNLDQLKKTHAQIVFIHQVITQRTQYFVDEFELAKDAAATVTAMANRISDDIKSKLDAAQREADEIARLQAEAEAFKLAQEEKSVKASKSPKKRQSKKVAAASTPNE